MATATLEKKEARAITEQKPVFRPRIALYENVDCYTVLVEMPGADEKAVQLRIEQGVLTIEAPLKLDLPADSMPIYSETRLGNFRRTLDIVDLVDEDKIEACFTAGLLKLTLPKSKSAKAHKIPIKTA